MAAPPVVAPDPAAYPPLRIMGSKHRLLPWLAEAFADAGGTRALDAFSGSGCVAYLLKTRGYAVHANDALAFACDLTRALVENESATLDAADVAHLLAPAGARRGDFIERTFTDIFFTPAELRLLDDAWANHRDLEPDRQALARAALTRACLKRQPRGVFTVAGADRYDDGRRDLRTPLAEHVRASVELMNGLVFASGRRHCVTRGDALAVDPGDADVVYLDPPYVPRADDNCYVKRYHFVEGLATYWQEGEILATSRVRKLRKQPSAFGSRRTAEAAFATLFRRLAGRTVVLSYSSNGWPDLPRLVAALGDVFAEVEVRERPHRYSFGTHGGVAAARAAVTEYILLARLRRRGYHRRHAVRRLGGRAGARAAPPRRALHRLPDRGCAGGRAPRAAVGADDPDREHRRADRRRRPGRSAAGAGGVPGRRRRPPVGPGADPPGGHRRGRRRRPLARRRAPCSACRQVRSRRPPTSSPT